MPKLEHSLVPLLRRLLFYHKVECNVGLICVCPHNSIGDAHNRQSAVKNSIVNDVQHQHKIKKEDRRVNTKSLVYFTPLLHFKCRFLYVINHIKIICIFIILELKIAFLMLLLLLLIAPDLLFFAISANALSFASLLPLVFAALSCSNFFLKALSIVVILV